MLHTFLSTHAQCDVSTPLNPNEQMKIRVKYLSLRLETRENERYGGETI